MGISYLNNDILVNGTSTAYVAGVLHKAGMHDALIGGIIGNWVIGATGNATPPPFDFATDVQAEDAAAVITYQRQFEHEDWIDGEDRVQASTTAEEMGFNARFHSIEAEFDAIRAQFLRLQTVVVDLRADLSGIVRELESKLTALERGLHELRAEKTKDAGPAILGTIKVKDQMAYMVKTGDDVQLLEYSAASLGGKIPQPPRDIKVEGRYRAETVRPEELVEIVASLEELTTAPIVLELLERGDATVGELLSLGGTTVLSSGVSLASVLAGIPADTELKGQAGAVATIAEQLVAGLPDEQRTKVLEGVVSDAEVRVATAAKVERASAEAVGLSTVIAGALAGAGLDATVGGLARSTTAEIAGKLAGTGAAVDVGALQSAVARGRLAGALARLR